MNKIDFYSDIGNIVRTSIKLNNILSLYLFFFISFALSYC
jgi:hypothetical protein